MDFIQSLVNRWANKTGLTACSVYVPIADGYDKTERRWGFFWPDGQVFYDEFQGICDLEIIGYLCQWGEITELESMLADSYV